MTWRVSRVGSENRCSELQSPSGPVPRVLEARNNPCSRIRKRVAKNPELSTLSFGVVLQALGSYGLTNEEQGPRLKPVPWMQPTKLTAKGRFFEQMQRHAACLWFISQPAIHGIPPTRL